jgi:hypothetical protein
VDRDQAIFTELGLADVQDAVDKVDIGPVEATRFAGTQAGAGQQRTGYRGETRRHADMSDPSSSSFKIRGGGMARDLGSARGSSTSVRAS